MEKSLAYLREPSISKIDPPVDSTKSELPIEKLAWEDFEKLCLRVTEIEYSIDECEIYGVKGQKQHGIDIFAKKANSKYANYQCKRHENITESTLDKAIDEFKKGKWFSKCDEFTFCTTFSLNVTQLQDKFNNLKDELELSGIALIKWDKVQLCRILKYQAQIVYDFFGKEWVSLFNGKDKLNTIIPNSKLDESDASVLYKRVFFSNLEKKYSTALTCSGLGEKNVLSCPSDELLIRDISCQLKLAKKCVLIGESGSGKSLVTFQVAKEFHDQGWLVYKLDKSSITKTTLLAAPSDKSFIIIDDVQTLAPNVIENIIDCAYDNFIILINWNSSISSENDFLHNYPCIDIIPARQVNMLKKYCLENKKDIKRILNEISVDTNPREYWTRIETRIEVASRENTPWLFNYSLTEGWRSTKNDMEMLRNKKRLDLVLVVVATYQYATLDNGVLNEVIIESLQNYNNDIGWLNKARNIIKKYCFSSDDLIRNKHYEYSRKVLQIFEDEKVNTDESLFAIDVFRKILLNDQYESGHSNILEFIMFHYRYCKYILVNDKTIQKSANNLFDNFKVGRKKIEKLNSLIRVDSNTLTILSENTNILRELIINCKRDCAYSLGNLINTLINEKFEFLVDVSLLDFILENIFSANREDKSGFAYLYNRINFFLDEDMKQYSRIKLMEANFFVNISPKSTEVDCYHFSNQIYELTCVSSTWANLCIKNNLNIMAAMMNENLMSAYRSFRKIIDEYFGVVYWVLGHINFEKENKRLAKLLASKLSVQTIISTFNSIETIDVQNFLNILYFIFIYEKKKIIEISEKINYEQLGKLYEGDKDLVHDHACMIRILYNPNSKKYVFYTSNLINNSKYIDELFIAINPELSLGKIESGMPFRMKFHDCRECKRILEIIKFIESEGDKQLALRVVSENINEIKDSIFSKSINVDDKKGKYDFLVFIYKNYPEVLKLVFEGNPKITELFEKIYRLIKGKVQEKNIARLYVFFIKFYTKEFSSEIEKIECKYPSVRKFSIG